MKGSKAREEKMQEYYQKYGEIKKEENLQSDNKVSKVPK